ncbi:MAG: cob(I)yrinic acid a,c-diamide adenosyltransferase [Planctomycetes bacterium]|jgi:cob(I)alamin adenosyltransferase|nr:cob(I)yrinic acid a,c-diamide adenosyltransferase [Planctomycetota bacterium]
MSIYTRFGDAGTTKRIDGAVISKTAPRVEALGALDELSSHLGLCIAEARAVPDRNVRLHTVRRRRLEQLAGTLQGAQRHLVGVGAMLAASGTDRADAVRDVGVTDETIRQMEAWIDWAWNEMPPLGGVILPGGCEVACRLHVARTVCRRAERAAIRLAEDGTDVPPLALAYLNRLSDTLFVLARLANFDEKGKDVLAHPDESADKD